MPLSADGPKCQVKTHGARGRNERKKQKCKYKSFLTYLYKRASTLNIAGDGFLWLNLEQQTQVVQMHGLACRGTNNWDKR